MNIKAASTNHKFSNIFPIFAGNLSAAAAQDKFSEA